MSDEVRIIDSKHGKPSLFELWRFKDLLFLLVRRDFVAFYKQTVFGPLWFFIQPLFTTFVFILLFGNIAKISTEGLPSSLFYLSGIILWSYFSDCLIKTSTVLRDNAHIFGKVYFPRMIMPISIVLSNLIKFGAQFILFILFYVYYLISGGIKFDIGYTFFLLPILLLFMGLWGLGLGLIISALTTKYRDLSYLVNFGVQLLMYATTVAYPLSAAPEKFKFLISINPMSSIIECFRLILFDVGSFEWQLLIIQVLMILLTLSFGICIFFYVERDFMDTV
ncbi:MAG: ABC transporter permease [Chitinophagaceae bacterium]|nr:ABC transporter permease [Chitinophagaceae bacterium]